MSRTIKGSKSCGDDYWSKRPYGGDGFGKSVKKITHKKERMIDKKLEREAAKPSG
jgi:hypothetical protein